MDTQEMKKMSVKSTTSLEPQNRIWCSKMFESLKRSRNQVSPELLELPDCDFFNVSPRRTLRILRPEVKSGHFYEAQLSDNRPESLNDNFYLRWAKRPHPSGNCRCSFRQSANSNRLSSYEDKIISQKIQRIRTSLFEAEKSGKDIQELEKSLALDLAHLQLPLDDKDGVDETDECGHKGQIETKTKSCQMKSEPLEDHVKKKIIKDLDRYISNLLDEILNDTIRAIAQADNPFDRKRRANKGSGEDSNFEISFAFNNGHEGHKGPEIDSKYKSHFDSKEGDNGYINQGFVGSVNDPDAVEFHLRHRLNADVILENADCIDSGINSVETIELQPEQEQNLEQSLMDIIDAKLGGTSIGKSLEDLGMEIDASTDAKAVRVKGAVDVDVPSKVVSKLSNLVASEIKKPKVEEKRVMISEESISSPSSPSSKSLEDALEEPAFNGLRLEFHRDSATSNGPEEKLSSNVTSKVNKTMFVIRQRIATRIANSRRKSSNNSICDVPHRANKPNSSGTSINSGSNSSTSSSPNSNKNNSDSSKPTTRASLELEDYRRRFPVPETNRHRHSKPEEVHGSSDDGNEVTLRNRNRKPMIVFLHGFGSSAEVFEHQLHYFTNLGYPCIAPDLLGHGLSSAPNRSKDYHFEKLFKDLELVLLHYAFKPGHKCVLVAHNYGCSFATALAYKYTSSVHQLVLISGGGPTPLAPPLSEGPGHCCLRASLAPFLVCGMQRTVLYSARGRQHPYCGSELFREQWPSHMRYVLQGMSWPDGDYVFHRRICTPSLLIHGLRDNKVSLVQECQMERTMIKAFLEAMPSAGHIPMTDCPEQLNHMIHCFIDLWKNKKW